MSAHALAPEAAPGFSDAHYFLLRRLHSLLGVAPLGVFLAEHFFTNSFAIKGPAAFNEKVDFLRGFPMLPLIEMAMIWAPLILHAALGIAIARQACHNPLKLGYWRNWLYTFQRYTGWIVLGYVAFHAGTLRFYHNPESLDFYRLLQGMFLQSPALLGIYIVGSLVSIFHFCNGLCTFCMTWGITVGRASQYWMGWAATAIGLGMATLMTASVLGFMGILHW